jgi:hypothetical protein
MWCSAFMACTRNQANRQIAKKKEAHDHHEKKKLLPKKKRPSMRQSDTNIFIPEQYAGQNVTRRFDQAPCVRWGSGQSNERRKKFFELAHIKTGVGQRLCPEIRNYPPPSATLCSPTHPSRKVNGGGRNLTKLQKTKNRFLFLQKTLLPILSSTLLLGNHYTRLLKGTLP